MRVKHSNQAAPNIAPDILQVQQEAACVVDSTGVTKFSIVVDF